MIITRLQGGMGNQMFQYAIGRSLSIKNNVPLKLDLAYLLDRTPSIKFNNFIYRDYDLDIFNIEAEIVDTHKLSFVFKNLNREGFVVYILKSVRLILEKFIKLKGKEKTSDFDASVLLLGGNIKLDGFWQSEKYFSDISEIIRKDFTLKNTLPDNINNIIEIINKENSLCLHVRRGDYVGNKNFEIITKEYYDNALEYVNKNAKVDKIYVFSDDIKWCEDNMNFRFPTVFIGNEYSGKKAEGHHAIMRACKYFIIPNSTFSWWAAWLSDRKDKIIVAPKKWFPSDSILRGCTDKIPDDWIRI